MTRRELLKKVAMGGTSLIVVPAFLMSCEKEGQNNTNSKDNFSGLEIDLSNSKYESLNSVGGYIVENNIIIINKANDEFIALSSICTHQGCTVSYDFGTDRLPCPCHGSVYSTSGVVLNGPAPNPLLSYKVTKNDNILMIS